ncbi:hypothetical protein LYNGBM3L_66240 [Moorena producens 3L]|uniref:Uncharacterized protein n=1 Tax=Moorena producens 3L TaxID=489825 RepID=F4Y1E1_9CYAN|nr:hypothetical protein LYNGBM3L_66240 [Moorena producens 3L]
MLIGNFQFLFSINEHPILISSQPNSLSAFDYLIPTLIDSPSIVTVGQKGITAADLV